MINRVNRQVALPPSAICLDAAQLKNVPQTPTMVLELCSIQNNHQKTSAAAMTEAQ
jgi:hypothetical protein